MSSAIPTKGMVRPEFVCASTRPLARSHADARLEAGVRSRAPRGGRSTAAPRAPKRPRRPCTAAPRSARRPWLRATSWTIMTGENSPSVERAVASGRAPPASLLQRVHQPASARGGRTCPWQTGCWAPRVSRRRSRSDAAVWQMGVNSGQWRSRAVRRKPSSWPHSGWFRRWRTASRPIGGVLYPGRARTVTIHLRGLPGDIGRAARPTLGLAPGGACRADRIAPVAGALLPHRFTLA